MNAYTAQQEEMNQAQMNVLATMIPEFPELVANLARAGLLAETSAHTIAAQFLPEDQQVVFKETSKPILREIFERHRAAIAAENAARAHLPLARTNATVVYPNEMMERQLALLEQDPITERRDRRVAEVRAKLEEYNRSMEADYAAARERMAGLLRSGGVLG
jgi:hypothetical protein